jgi:dolichol kinase
LVLLITYYTRQLDALHKTERKSLGSIIFPIPVYVCFLAATFYNNHLLFFLPLSLLTFADPAAEWGGKRWGQHTASFFNKQKTIAGTLSFAAIALLIGIIYITFYHLSFQQRLLLLIGMPIITAAVECISLNGMDNITIPLSSLALLYIILQVS